MLARLLDVALRFLLSALGAVIDGLHIEFRVEFSYRLSEGITLAARHFGLQLHKRDV